LHPKLVIIVPAAELVAYLLVQLQCHGTALSLYAVSAGR
jgi:hypothetical protein